MKKVDRQFILTSYDNGIENYRQAVSMVGLWQSEQYVFEKYLQPDYSILDLGCGAGRTTFALYQIDFRDLRGVDLNPKMIQAAMELATEKELPIPFQTGDATYLEFSKAFCDAVIFSFNGIMTIPGKENRSQAFNEIYRVLKPGGIFLFTTHDREANTQYIAFWEEEVRKWQAGRQDARIHDFGDLVTFSDDVRREIFIHIPTRSEIIAHLENAGFELLEDFYRSERFTESETVKHFSADCRFWVAKKQAD